MIDEMEPHCPNCDYDLRGLPIPHRCPECGTHVDLVQTVWKPTLDSIAHWSVWLRLSILIVVALTAILLVPESRLALGIFVCLVASVGGLIVAIVLHEYRVTFEPSGLHLRRPFSRECIAWERISHFGRSRAKWQLWSVELKDPLESRLLPPVLSDSISVRDFHRSLALAKSRWGRKVVPVTETRIQETRGGEQRWGDLTDVLRNPRRNGPCPWCNYELTGHPARSVCPSCGNEYSPALRVWEKQSRLVYPIAAIGFVPFIAFMIYMWSFVFQDKVVPRSHKSILLGLFGAGVMYAMFVARVLFPKQQVIADERGVEIRRFGKKGRISWAQISSVRRDGANVLLTTPAGPRRIDCFFGNVGDAEDFVRHAERLIKAQHATDI